MQISSNFNIVSRFGSWMKEHDSDCQDNLFHNEGKGDLLVKISCLHPQSMILSRKTFVRRFISDMAFCHELNWSGNSNTPVFLNDLDSLKWIRGYRDGTKHRKIGCSSHVKPSKTHRLDISKHEHPQTTNFETSIHELVPQCQIVRFKLLYLIALSMIKSNCSAPNMWNVFITLATSYTSSHG